MYVCICMYYYVCMCYMYVCMSMYECEQYLFYSKYSNILIVQSMQVLNLKCYIYY